MFRTTVGATLLLSLVGGSAVLAGLEVTTWTIAGGLRMPRVDAGGGWITYSWDRDPSVYYYDGESWAYEVATDSSVRL